ncbi:RNase H domain-containing protein [Trichonephila clavipes]|nr:RNase H domain-containing protein [Trichonephila clavipes]
MKMRVLSRSRQNDRLRVMLVLVHIAITSPQRSGYFGEVKTSFLFSRDPSTAGSETAVSLAKDGAAQHSMNSAALAYSELHTTYINNKQTTVPPAHHWYEAKRPGVVLLPFNAAGRNKIF